MMDINYLTKEQIIKHIYSDRVEYKDLPQEYFSDKEVTLAAVERDSSNIQYASKSMKNDKEIVAIATKQDLHMFKYASDMLKNNKEFVKKLVSRDGFVVRYASEELRSDYEVMKLAMSNNITSFFYASQELQNNLELLQMLRRKKVFVKESVLSWLGERMAVLDILEDEAMMRESAPEAPHIRQVKKF